MGQSPTTVDGDYASLAGCVTCAATGVDIEEQKPYSTISTITLTVKDCTLTRIPITIRGLYNKWGTPIGTISINISYDVKNGWTYTMTGN